MGGKEEIWVQKAHVSPFPKNHPNPSTDLPARKKHDAVPPRLLNADPLAWIIGHGQVITDDALDSRATTDIMTLAYAKARNFDIRPMTELSDRFMNINLVAGFKTTVYGYVKCNLQLPGISSYDSDRVTIVAEDNSEFGKEVPLTIVINITFCSV